VLNVADARPLLNSGDVTLKYSSSAKGGLAVAAMGLVPSITLESAKVTAHSAGAKIAQYYSYKLNRHDIRALEDSPPDILLFTGGTDGGEELRSCQCPRAGSVKAGLRHYLRRKPRYSGRRAGYSWPQRSDHGRQRSA
jgi:uncharacterized protein (TIGR01319 family)